MRKALLIGLVLLLVLSVGNVFAQGQSDAGKSDGYVIGFVNGYWGNNWRAQFVDGAEEVANKWKERGIIKDFIVQNVNDDVTKQIVQLNALLDQGVDCLIINPVSAESLAGVVRRAKQLGVLIVNCDDPAAYEGTFTVAGDHRAFMGIYARWFAEQFKNKGPADVVHMHGLAGNSCDKVRVDEVYRIFKEYPNIKIIAEAPGGWNQTTAQQNMSNWLSTYSKIDGVMTHDIHAEGIMRAYDIVGRKYPTMTGDYNMGFLRKWAANPDMNTIAVTYNPGIGGDAVEVAVRLLMGWTFKEGSLIANQVDPKLINTVMVPPAFVVTKDGSIDPFILKDYDTEGFTNIISLEQALKLGEGKDDAYLLDGILSDAVVDNLFVKPAGWKQTW